VDEDGAAPLGRPNPVFNVFVAVDDEPGPSPAGIQSGVPDAQQFKDAFSQPVKNQIRGVFAQV